MRALSLAIACAFLVAACGGGEKDVRTSNDGSTVVTMSKGEPAALDSSSAASSPRFARDPNDLSTWPPCANGDDCPVGAYCDVAKSCGASGAKGACAPKPPNCTNVPDPKPVCACDGKTYENGCVAAYVGQSVKSDGACK